jgi:hypothetical protein
MGDVTFEPAPRLMTARHAEVASWSVGDLDSGGDNGMVGRPGLGCLLVLEYALP